MSRGAGRFDASVTDISTAGSAAQLKNSPDKVKWIKFKARTGTVFIGQSDVNSTNGYPLWGTAEWGELEIDFGDGSVKMSDFYADAGANGDDVGWIVILE